MPSTQPYVPTFDFENDPDPQDKLDAAALSAQLALISDNFTDTLSGLGVAIGDDDTLTDEIVRLRNLHPEVVDLLDQVAAGAQAIGLFTFKYPVVVATTGNITLSGEQTIDGVLTSGSYVLVKDQSTASQNGLYTSAAGAWTRRSDLPAASSSGSGWAVQVASGTTNARTTWALLAGGDTLPVVGTDSLTFYNPASAGGSFTGARVYSSTISFNNAALTQDVSHNLGETVQRATLTAVSGGPVLIGVQASVLTANSMRFVFPTQPGAVSVKVTFVG